MIRQTQQVEALNFTKVSVGRHFKASKKRYTWQLALDGQSHTVDMFVSELSGRRKMLLDGEVKYTGKAQTGIFFQFPFKVGLHSLCVVQQDSEWDLKVDSLSFSRLMRQQPKMWNQRFYQETQSPLTNREPATAVSDWDYPSTAEASGASWNRLSPRSSSLAYNNPNPIHRQPESSDYSPHSASLRPQRSNPRFQPESASIHSRQFAPARNEWGDAKWEDNPTFSSLPARPEKKEIDLLDMDAPEPLPTPKLTATACTPKSQGSVNLFGNPPVIPPKRVAGTPSASRNPFLPPQAPGPISNPMAAALLMQSYAAGAQQFHQKFS